MCNRHVTHIAHDVQPYGYTRSSRCHHRLVATAEAIEPDHEVETEHKVTPLELFFDLVFVLAITQVTQLMADDPTWKGLTRGMLVLAVLWWGWAAYAWLTNDIEADEGGTRIAMFAAMAAFLVVALAVPGAFNENAFEFALAYTAVRVMHIILYALATNDVGVRG